MAFDGGFLHCVINEINDTLRDAKVEKIYQTSHSELVFAFHTFSGPVRLLISAAAESSRIHITETKPENPRVPPMFCMLLRKHLTGGRLRQVEQIGFDRVCRLVFDVVDELGDRDVRYIYCELMGRNSNIIFCRGDDTVIAPVRAVDASMSSVRMVLPGLNYVAPPINGKISPLDENTKLDVTGEDTDREIVKRYQGISPLIAREIVFRATNEDIGNTFDSFFKHLEDNNAPTLITVNGRDEITYTDIGQYGAGIKKRVFSTYGALCDFYYTERALREKIAQRSADLHKICSSARSRIIKKLEIRRMELSEAEKKDEYKSRADLITANIYKIKKGQGYLIADDYSADPPAQVRIELDTTLSPSANAQRLYKKYTKLKTAETVLREQIETGEKELAYIQTVSEGLEFAESEADLSEIRAELVKSGIIYGTKENRKTVKQRSKEKIPEPMEFLSSGGHTILCGKNNIQNDYIRSRGRGDDFWFHAHGIPGSHVVLLEGDKGEPSDEDKNEAALIAIYYSSSGGRDRTEVDYTRLKEVKHPAGSAPGYVIYHKYQTASVLPDDEKMEEIKKRRMK